MAPKQAETGKEGEWRDSRNVCVYADNDRLLGHIVRTGEMWIAYDATHAASHGSAFRPLGFFPSLIAAKRAVECATSTLPRAEAEQPRWNVV